MFTTVIAQFLGGSLPHTDAGYLVSVVVGLVLLIGGIILLRLQKYL
mgnify:CR=1 FL=1